MKIGKVEVIGSTSTRIEMKGGSAGALVLALFAVVSVVGAVKIFQLHTEVRKEIEKMRNEG